MDTKNIRIDGIKWFVYTDEKGIRTPQPLCPNHHIRMYPIPPLVYDSFYKRRVVGSIENSIELNCEEGPHILKIPRIFSKEKRYVIDRIDAKIFEGMKTVNLDDEAIPVAESKDKNGKYFVTSKILETKRGPQLVIYAGETGKKTKAQIFAEPEIKRLDFDRNDLHPDEVFVEVTAKFKDGSSHSIKKDAKKVKNGPAKS